MRVFITGATGFIGTHVVHRFVEAGWEVAALVRRGANTGPLSGLTDRLTLVEGDLRQADSLTRSIVAINPSVCVHLAWYVGPGYLHAVDNFEAVAGTAALLGALSQSQCRKVVFVGSCAEYEPCAACLEDDSPIGPRTLYAACKRAAWLMVEQIARLRGWSALNPRLFNVYGPGEPEARLVPSVVRALLAGDRSPLTSGDQMRDFLHVQDVADALWAISSSDIEGPINVASGIPTPAGDVAREIARQLGRPDLLDFGVLPQAIGTPPWLCARPGRLHTALGWTPRFSLASGLEQTIGWWRQRIHDAGRLSAVSN